PVGHCDPVEAVLFRVRPSTPVVFGIRRALADHDRVGRAVGDTLYGNGRNGGRGTGWRRFRGILIPVHEHPFDVGRVNEVAVVRGGGADGQIARCPITVTVVFQRAVGRTDHSLQSRARRYRDVFEPRRGGAIFRRRGVFHLERLV